MFHLEWGMILRKMLPQTMYSTSIGVFIKGLNDCIRLTSTCNFFKLINYLTIGGQNSQTRIETSFYAEFYCVFFNQFSNLISFLSIQTQLGYILFVGLVEMSASSTATKLIDRYLIPVHHAQLLTHTHIIKAIYNVKSPLKVNESAILEYDRTGFYALSMCFLWKPC